MNLTDLMNSINFKKNDLSEDPDFEKNYNPYVINKCVANCRDTLFYAANISKYSNQVPKQYQYYYYLHSLRPKKRFGKWFKKDKESDNIKAIKEYYHVNSKIAEEYLKLLSDEQIAIIIQETNKGG